MARGVRWSFLPAELEVGDLAQLSLDDLCPGLPQDTRVVGLIVESSKFPLIPAGRSMPTLQGPGDRLQASGFEEGTDVDFGDPLESLLQMPGGG